jgi:hypothetical protein
LVIASSIHRRLVNSQAKTHTSDVYYLLTLLVIDHGWSGSNGTILTVYPTTGWWAWQGERKTAKGAILQETCLSSHIKRWHIFWLNLSLSKPWAQFGLIHGLIIQALNKQHQSIYKWSRISVYSLVDERPSIASIVLGKPAIACIDYSFFALDEDS